MLTRLINAIFGQRSVNNERPFSNRVNTYSGELVTPSTAMQLSAVYACVRVISEDIASLPFFVYQRTERGRVKADKHAIYRLLHDWPNEDMTPMAFKEAMMYSVLLNGNAYAYINKMNSVPFELLPLHPGKVKVERDKRTGVVTYRANVGGEWRNVPTDRMFHLKGLGDDGLLGKSPIEQCAQAFGVALAIDKFSASFFGKGALLAGYLKTTTTGKLDEGVRAELKNSWAEMMSGNENAHGVPVLPLNLEYVPLGVNPEQCQFLQSKAYSAVDIARIFRLSPTKIGDLTKSNYNTLEAAGIDHVRSTLRPYLLRWEQEANRKLFLEAERPTYYAEFEPAALMRGDTAQQNADFALGLQWGWYSRNEVRRMKNLPEIEGGNLFNMPLNMAPLNEVAKAEEEAKEALPADEPKEPEEPAKEGEPQAEPSSNEADRFAPLVHDAAKRIATKIERALEREASKGNADLAGWLDDYLADKRQVFAETVKPLSMSISPATGFLDADNFGDQLRSNLPRQLSDALAFDALPEFRANVTKYVVTAFKESHGTPSLI